MLEIQGSLFNTVDYAVQGPVDKLSPDARENLKNSFGYGTEQSGSPYMPSHGTEGSSFMRVWCDRCVHDDIDTEKFCDILTVSFLDEQPIEWTYEGGRACCSKFEIEK